MQPRKKVVNFDTKKQNIDIKPQNSHHSDHELFIQAYEKPTQIYKFLRTRFLYSPYFQYRNLAYMMRKPKSITGRRNFKVDSLLAKVQAQSLQISMVNPAFEYVTITYFGFFDEEGSSGSLNIETFLLKVCHDKRKEHGHPVRMKSFGTVSIPRNPIVDSLSARNKIVIGTKSFLCDRLAVKSYHLLFRIALSKRVIVDQSVSDGDDSKIIKKRKLIRKINEKIQYGGNLTIHDERNRCLLPEGDYQLLMEELKPNGGKLPHTNSFWMTIPEEEAEKSPALGDFLSGPKLKLYLNWTNNPEGEDNFDNESSMIGKKPPSKEATGNNKENRNPDKNKVAIVAPATRSIGCSSNFQIVYQFLYGKRRRQQTEPIENCYCPWCPKLNCLNLYALVKHLKLCHARFIFLYTEIANGARIDVALNEKYDGSCSDTDGNVQNNIFGFTRRAPIRRLPVSKILVYRPRRQRQFNLSEFVNEKYVNDGDWQRIYINGHDRVYYHSTTCLPIRADEIDVDSEDEKNPAWLRRKTSKIIDDFTDVNDGEKEMMRMWNLHVLKYGFVGSSQMLLACMLFVKTHCVEIFEKKLYRNFVLHLCNMFDFGLISSLGFYIMMQKLTEMIGKRIENNEILRESWSSQCTNWLQ